MKKAIYIIIAIIIIAGGYYFYDRSNKQAKAPNGETTEDISGDLNTLQQETGDNSGQSQGEDSAVLPSAKPVVDPEAKITGTFSTGDESGEGSDVQVIEVVYDGSKFSPSTINIKVNDWVFFKNESSTDFWPASAPHPSHADYPEFDAGKALAPQKTFKFQFAKAGEWKYHNHLNPSAFGTVNVK